MALTEFVRNVEDLSDDGGYKFRFHCDKCSDGVESQYISSRANVLKTGLEVFQMFRNFGWGSSAVSGIDRGLRGKEHDAAYERAVAEAGVHFSKCTRCGVRVCEQCWNPGAGLCETCAPVSSEQAAAASARYGVQQAVDAVQHGELTTAAAGCTMCGQSTGGGRFCVHCGAPTSAHVVCGGCGAELAPAAAFCGGCGQAVR